MSLFRKKPVKDQLIKPVVSLPSKPGDMPLNADQIEEARRQISLINDMLRDNKYTRRLHLASDKLTSDSYIRHTPATPTGKPSKYPYMIFACSSMYGGYSLCLYYLQSDEVGKAQAHIAAGKLSYTIDFRRDDGALRIIKVITTDDNYNNDKLYHIMADGTVYQK